MDKETQFKTAVEANKDRIYRICCCYVRDEHERRDVFQEVLIHIWEGLDRFGEKSQISTWIYRIAVNTCLGHIRMQTRRRKVFDGSVYVDQETIADASASEGSAETEHAVSRLYDCINQLLPLEKTLVSLYLEDLRTEQMSEVVGISEGNVRVKLHRIKKKLKEMMEGDSHGS
jgi:RNA polymerase sigma-70 factor (ECF subfamily)